MPKVILYIATSLDGFIARPDGNLDWLTSFPQPKSGDYGYNDLLNSISTIVMGRKTYDEILAFGIEWPYTEYNTYVVTKNKSYKTTTPNTFTLNENLGTFVKSIKDKSEKDIWLVGGGSLVTAFINENILDKMIISKVPVLLGEGIPLFAHKPKETSWELKNTQAFDTGIVNLTYEKVDS